MPAPDPRSALRLPRATVGVAVQRDVAGSTAPSSVAERQSAPREIEDRQAFGSDVVVDRAIGQGRPDPRARSRRGTWRGGRWRGCARAPDCAAPRRACGSCALLSARSGAPGRRSSTPDRTPRQHRHDDHIGHAHCSSNASFFFIAAGAVDDQVIEPLRGRGQFLRPVERGDRGRCRGAGGPIQARALTVGIGEPVRWPAAA